MSAIEKAAEMLRHEAETLKACHTLGDDWCGDPAEADYHEMIAVADAAIAERAELLEALQWYEAKAVQMGRAAIGPRQQIAVGVDEGDCRRIRLASPRSNRQSHRRLAMTPKETTTILRQFNEWCLSDEDLPQPDAKQITAAIYAAVEMIERLEQIEAAAQNLVKMKGRHNTEIAYQRLVDALEKLK